VGLHALDQDDAPADGQPDVSADAGGLGSRDAGVGEVRGEVKIADLGSFDSTFGSLGLKVGPRTGPNKRSQDDKEWYVVRRFMWEATSAGMFRFPLLIRKANPPEPDFALGIGDTESFIEITEATDEADQREMTTFELSENSVALLGTFGGRFADGASQPGRAWAADVLDAIERKKGKTIFSGFCANHHLVIYPSSNASSLLFDGKGEKAAIGFLRAAIADRHEVFTRIANGCAVHILGNEYICLDVLNRAKFIRRQYYP
jgi:hypothetical protein